ncbi:MAG: glycosyl transferase-like UDP-glucuronosyltransferase [Sphingomonas sp.]|nr:glycosyl transferase-like UDP-glucuronosyltransferase [Sphingomonas sp.]
MARVLIGWEFGANRGHAVRLTAIADALQTAGHDISFAVTRLDAMHAQKVPAASIWQAPVSPRMMAGRARAIGPAVGMADILARLGMDDPLIVVSMLSGWHRLFDAIRPDLVIADFAPFLLLAARGRLPTISVGTGFTSPPSGMATLPALISGAAGTDQAALLAAVNDGLAQDGEPPLAALPQMFAADRPVVATFAELDPYAGDRAEPLVFPDAHDPAVPGGGGDEIFAYFPDFIPADSPLWLALAASGLKVRVHIGLGGAALQAAVARHGLIVEPEPVPFARIAERSRLLVSHGGHGFICAGLVAGLPHVVCHFDLEKLTHGLALARVGLGGHVALSAIRPQPFAQSLVQLFNDEAIAGRAHAAAPVFRGRGQAPFRQAMLEAVTALA